MTFTLVNPVIHEKSITSKEKQSGGAAQDIWEQLSNNIKHYTSKFYFSIANTKNNKLSHYKVKENNEDGKIKYVISEYKNIDESLPVDKDMKGGKRRNHRKHDDSSSSSSSDSDSSSDSYVYYPNSKSRRNYNSGVSVTYYPSIYGVKDIILPTFSSVIAPYPVNLVMNSAPFVFGTTITIDP